MNLILPIHSLFLLILLLIIFFSKAKIKSDETNLYCVLLLISFFNVSFNIIGIYLGYNNGSMDFLHILNHFDLPLYFWWASILFLYLTFAYEKNHDRYKKIKIYVLFLNILFTFVSIFLPFEVIITETTGYAIGLCVNFTYFICAIYLILCLIMTCLLIKRNNFKKTIPIFSFIIMGIIAALIQKNIPSLIIVPSVIVFVEFIMYFTIENPDIKIIKELQFIKLLLEKENDVVKNGFNDLSLKLKEPLSELSNFANMNIPTGKEKEYLNNIKKESSLLVDQINSIIDITRIENNVLENNLNYYKTEELIDSIKEIIDRKKIQAIYNVSDDIPATLYGNINQIKQIIIYLTSFINKSFTNFKLSIIISKIQVGNICKLKFNFALPIEALNSNIELSKINNKYVLNTDNIEYMVYQKLIEQYNNKCVLELNDKNICFNFQLYNKMNANYVEDKINDEKISHYFDASNKRLLILDDNRKNVKEIVDMLNPYKVNIDVSTNIEELITQIDSNKIYDLILYSDTVNVIKEYIVNNENIPRIISRIRLIAGYKIPLVILGNKKYKNIDYIIKPVDKHELNNIMLKYLADDEKNDSINKLK